MSDNFDTSKVVRPREHNLIQNIHTDYGIKNSGAHLVMIKLTLIS